MIIKICSRKEIQKLVHSVFPEKTAVISYFGEGEKPVFIPEHIGNIRLNIDDIQISEVDDPEDYHICEFRRVANFILNCAEQKNNLICQCEAGISRSAATAAAILEFYEQKGIKIFPDFRYSPNKLFYNNILKCLREEYRRRLLSDLNCKDKNLIEKANKLFANNDPFPSDEEKIALMVT